VCVRARGGLVGLITVVRSVTSVLAVSTKRSAKQFARGQRGGIFTVSIPVLARTAEADTPTTAPTRLNPFKPRES
jgi:hypothetical protein